MSKRQRIKRTTKPFITCQSLLLLQGELECRCKGSALVRVPQRLPVNMQRLSISTAGIPMLRYTGLKIYGSSLQDM